MKRSNDSFLMRMLILALFWLFINFFYVSRFSEDLGFNKDILI